MTQKLMIGLAGVMMTGSTGFAAEGDFDGRVLSKEVTVNASREKVWYAWTTEQGIASFFSPDSRIEMTIGGPYELFMGMADPDENGLRGSEGCKLLSYLPFEMISFEWNFPPAVSELRSKKAKTYVVLRFHDNGDGTVDVRFDQVGWREGEAWDKGYEYFDRAWSYVLKNLQTAADEGKLPTPDRSLSDLKTKMWTDGKVEVVAIRGPWKRQSFAVTIPASVEKTWKALTTTAGLRHLFHPEAEVDLKLGGRYDEWPGAEHKILTLIPGQMLSGTGGAPPSFPAVQKGGTWWVYLFEPEGEHATRLHMALMGWHEHAGEEEWEKAFDYFLKANAEYLNGLPEKIAKWEQ